MRYTTKSPEIIADENRADLDEWLIHERRWWNDLAVRHGVNIPNIHRLEVASNEERRDLILALLLEKLLRRVLKNCSEGFE